MAKNFKTTYVACFFGVTNQAVIANITAILFVPFIALYGYSAWQLGVLIGVNYFSQMLADIIVTKLIDRIPYRAQVLSALVLSILGIVAYAFAPNMGNVFIAMIVATVIFSFGGGMLEVILTPIVDATEEGDAKSKMIALLHSLYPWGQLLCILVTALSLFAFGNNVWQIIMLGWTIIPIIGIVLFSVCPINQPQVNKEEKRKAITSKYAVMLMIAIGLGGATELFANQYVSTFAVIALGIEKVFADIFGMGLFAILMGVGRVIFGNFGHKFDMRKVLMFCALAAGCLYLIMGLSPNPIISFIACILCGFAVSFLWPGALVVAGKKLPGAGGTIFAILAICGDVGGSVIPTGLGLVGDTSMTLMFVIGAIVPLLCSLCYFIMIKKEDKLLCITEK